MPSRREQIAMSDEEVVTFLEEERTVQVCTIGPDGRPHLMPLWYVVDEGPALRGWTFAKSQKTKNLERDPRATVGVDAGEQYHELRGVMFECDVEIERDPEKLVSLGEAIFKRYGDGSDLPEEALEVVRKQAEKRVGLTFTPTKRVSWDHRKLEGVY